MSEPQAKKPKLNNQTTDWSLIAGRFLFGPFVLCKEDRKKASVVDNAEEGCEVRISMCSACRRLNKMISYDMRMGLQAVEDYKGEGNSADI